MTRCSRNSKNYSYSWNSEHVAKILEAEICGIENVHTIPVYNWQISYCYTYVYQYFAYLIITLRAFLIWLWFWDNFPFQLFTNFLILGRFSCSIFHYFEKWEHFPFFLWDDFPNGSIFMGITEIYILLFKIAC